MLGRAQPISRAHGCHRPKAAGSTASRAFTQSQVDVLASLYASKQLLEVIQEVFGVPAECSSFWTQGPSARL